MREGFWINYETRRFIGLHCPGMEHEIVIRGSENQEWLGIPASVAKALHRYRPQVDRIRLLRFVMKNAPLMRIRGYGCNAEIQYFCPEGDEKPYAMISRWLKRWGGPRLMLDVSNLATGRTHHVLASDWPTFVKARARKQDVQFKGAKRHASFQGISRRLRA